MWKCHKCGKPVYFAERKQSLGYDWHPECLRCEECSKRLNPGQHAEHKGVPYCHVPCYGALFGPQLFGHGSRVEAHKNFGARGVQKPGQQSGTTLPRDHLESKLKVYNQFFDNKSMEIRSREVNNRLVLEGALRVYWGVHGVIHLKEDDDQRTLVVRKRNSCRLSKGEKENCSDKENNDLTESLDGDANTSDQIDALSTDVSLSESMTFDSCSLNEYAELPTTPEEASANVTNSNISNGREDQRIMEGQVPSPSSSISSSLSINATNINNNNNTLPTKLNEAINIKWDEIDDLLQVERRVNDKDPLFGTMPAAFTSQNSSNSQTPTSSSNSNEQAITTDSSNTNSNTNTPIDKSSTALSSSTTSSASLSSSSTTSPTTSSDKFLTANASTFTKSTDDTTTVSTSTNIDNYETDDATLKPIDFEEFKRSVHQDYVNGANSLPEPDSDTLKRNQPIDPSRINDSLKLYNASEHPMSKSFNCVQALRTIDSMQINDTIIRRNEDSPQKRYPFTLQKNGSNLIYSTNNNNFSKKNNNHNSYSSSCSSSNVLMPNGRNYGPTYQKCINRSKSGPSCFDFSDSENGGCRNTNTNNDDDEDDENDNDDDSTLKPNAYLLASGEHISSTIRKSNIIPRYIQLRNSDNIKDSGSDFSEGYSRQDDDDDEFRGFSNSGDAGGDAGDELTQTDELYTAPMFNNTSEVRRNEVLYHNTSQQRSSMTNDGRQNAHITDEGVVLRRPPRTGATAIKRRSGNRRSRTKLKRRCSINGHYYNRETSFFTPPYGSQMSVWITSLVTTQEVINLLLEKYKVDSPAENFSLFIIRDNGEQKRLKDTEYPLINRIMLGPHEDVAKLYLVDGRRTDEISNEVAQFLNLSLPECRAILERYDQELERETVKVKDKYAELRRRILIRMESLKVHL